MASSLFLCETILKRAPRNVEQGLSYVSEKCDQPFILVLRLTCGDQERLEAEADSCSLLEPLHLSSSSYGGSNVWYRTIPKLPSTTLPILPRQSILQSTILHMFGLGRTDVSSTTVTQAAVVDDSTPWVAAADGDLGLLQTALQQLQLPVTAQDENGYTLLQAAISYNQAHVWQWLATQPQFTVHAVDKEGDSALHYATTPTAARFLVQAGIDTTLRNSENQTALEKKREELQEMRDDEDFDESDYEYVQLVAMVDYLSSLNNVSQ